MINKYDFVKNPLVRLLIATAFFFVFSTVVHAQLIITEIMYNLFEDSEGSKSDAKREWIEVYNNGSESVDVTDWRFNDGSNHKLVAPPENGGQGSLIIESNSYAIFASDAATFISENIYSGTVIDTVMSLNNITDTLSLINDTGVTVDDVMYTKELGGDEDGNSLQLIAGTFVGGIPTPGYGYERGEDGSQEEHTPNPPTSGGEEESNSSTQTSSGSVAPITTPKIIAIAPNDRTVISGAAGEYRVTAFGTKNKPLANARYVWNFGNGVTKEGQSILHTYSHPGEYVLILNVSSDKLSSSDRALITVVEGDILISRVSKGIIELQNRESVELNLSWWQLKFGEDIFMLPRDTIILSGKKLIFSESVTNLMTNSRSDVSLLYPNGIVAHTYGDDNPFIPQVSNVPSGNPKASSVVIKSIAAPLAPKEENKAVVNNMEASVLESLTNSESSKGELFVWLLGLIALIGVAIAGVVLGRDKNTADDIEILD